MKIFIITQEEPFYLPDVVRTVVSAWKKDLVGMTVLSSTRGKKRWQTVITTYYRLYGATTFLYQGSRFVFYRLMNLAERYVPVKGFYSVRAVAQRYRVPLYPTPNINQREYLESLRLLAPDVVVSISANQIFKHELLSLPRLGCINVHGGPLPRYRGRLPSFWVLFNGEQETGVTVHTMNDQIDDGPILAQRRVAIVPGETQHSLILKTKSAGAQLLIETVEKLKSGILEPRPNDRSQATYYSFPTPRDGRKFRDLGLRFI
jgi:methionyl-tRNA formyltransferase